MSLDTNSSPTTTELIALIGDPTTQARTGALTASRVFALRALWKIRRVPEQLSDVIAVPIIFTLLFTYLFGGALAGSPHRYLQYLLPGTLTMAVLLATMYTGVNLNADLDKGVYDRFRTLPIWRPAPIVGALLGDTLRYTLAAALVIGLGLALGYRPHGGVSGCVLAVVLVVVFAVALSWVFTLLGLLLRTPSAIMNVAFVVLFPLTLASNTFVDPATMPGWLHTLVDLNPVSHLVSTVRAAMAGSVTIGQVSTVLLTAVTVAAVFAPLTMRAYYRKH
ncbi:ABC transporter permease [Nocardia sp. NPDC020380]|uniref:ABC transporter permease n=1 Tax=Nocardia sp. NPDC020380 TaxID=3364309 RepID=UPI0037ADAE40